MAVDQTLVEFVTSSVVAGVPIEVDIQTFDKAHVIVTYGANRNFAAPDTHYTVAIAPGPSYRPFTVTPTAALVAAMNADALFQLQVKRILPLITTFNNTDAQFRERIADEFDRNMMIDQQLEYELGLTLHLGADGESWDAQGNRIINVGDPIDQQDAATRSYIDSQIASVIADYLATLPIGGSFPTPLELTASTALSALEHVNRWLISNEEIAGTDLIHTLPDTADLVDGTPIFLKKIGKAQQDAYRRTYLNVGHPEDVINADGPFLPIIQAYRADIDDVSFVVTSFTGGHTVNATPYTPFLPGHVNSTIHIKGAGPGGTDYEGVINGYTSPSVVELTDPVSVDAIDAPAYLGTLGMFGVDGDTRARLRIDWAPGQRIITTIERQVRVGSLVSGDTSVAALSGQISGATHAAQEGFAQTRIFLNDVVMGPPMAAPTVPLSDNVTGNVALICQQLKFRIQDDFVHLVKTGPRRWSIFGSSVNVTPEGRDFIHGRIAEERYKGFGTSIQAVAHSTHYISSNYNRFLSGTNINWEIGDVAETQGGRAQVKPGSTHPEGPELTWIGAGVGVYVVWAAGWNGDGGTGGSFFGRGAQIQFASVGAHSATNAALEMRFGVSLEGTTGSGNNRVFVQYISTDERVTFGRSHVQSAKVSVITLQDQPSLFLHSQFTGLTADVAVFRASEATATTAFDFIECQTGPSGGGAGSPKFRVRGDGTVYSDGGTAMTSPAGLSEMIATHAPGFEPKPGDDLDGCTVVMVDVKDYNRVISEGMELHEGVYVRLCDSFASPEFILDDDIIGVVHSQSPLKGASAGLHKHDKYLQDAYGKPIYEEKEYVEWNVYEVNDAAKSTEPMAMTAMEKAVGGFLDDLEWRGTEVPRSHEVTLAQAMEEAERRNYRENWTFVSSPVFSVQKRRIINPHFNRLYPYQERSERLEWASSVDALGNVTGGLFIEVIGMCPVRDGQRKPKRWRRVRPIKDHDGNYMGASMYLIR